PREFLARYVDSGRRSIRAEQGDVLYPSARNRIPRVRPPLRVVQSRRASDGASTCPTAPCLDALRGLCCPAPQAPHPGPTKKALRHGRVWLGMTRRRPAETA